MTWAVDAQCERDAQQSIRVGGAEDMPSRLVMQVRAVKDHKQGLVQETLLGRGRRHSVLQFAIALVAGIPLEPFKRGPVDHHRTV